MTQRFPRLFLAAALLAGSVGAGAQGPETPQPATAAEMAPAASEPGTPPADRLVSEITDPVLRRLLDEVLERNPKVAAARARARAAEERAPQVRALPDPMTAVTGFLLTPETRVGPQQLMLSLSQKLPWFGKLNLAEKAALSEAAAARADIETERLSLVTETRRLYLEIGFLDTREEIVGVDRSTLVHYEQVARTRYASGVGLQQSVLKIQAEITKDESRLIEIARRRASLVAALNALRDLPQDTPVEPIALAPAEAIALDLDGLTARAREHRPELVRSAAEIARAESLRELALKGYRPDVTLGLTYTLVGERQDRAGRLSPPQGNGDDILGVSAGINLPIHRKKLAAGVEEAVARREAAEEAERAVLAAIDRSLGDLTARLRLTWRQLRLFEDVLTPQAEESLSSAEAAYTAGSVGSLDLLDAERVLLEVRTSAARTRADYSIAEAELEGAVAAPVSRVTPSTGATVRDNNETRGSDR